MITEYNLINVDRKNCPKTSGIYQIFSKTNNKKYIGGCVNLYKRMHAHLAYFKRKNHINKNLKDHVNKYGIKDLVYSILEFCPIDKLRVREQFYINTLKPEFNISPTAGSQLGYKHSEITKLKIRNILTGRKLTEEHCKKISISNKGMSLSEETKIKIGNANRGKKHPMSEETKRKQSIAHIGLLKGKHLSEEHKKLLSIKAKLRPSNRKGVTLSEETKNKISISKLKNKQI